MSINHTSKHQNSQEEVDNQGKLVHCVFNYLAGTTDATTTFFHMTVVLRRLTKQGMYVVLLNYVCHATICSVCQSKKKRQRNNSSK